MKQSCEIGNRKVAARLMGDISRFDHIPMKDRQLAGNLLRTPSNFGWQNWRLGRTHVDHAMKQTSAPPSRIRVMVMWLLMLAVIGGFVTMGFLWNRRNAPPELA